LNRREFAIDAAIALTLALVLGALTSLLYRFTGGLIPQHNVYFGADTDRVVANLIDPQSDFSRAIVHPLYGLLCVPFQKLVAKGVGLNTAFAGLAIANGAVFAVSLYAAIRVWGGARIVAAASVLLAASFGSFVYWAGVPETHLVAGITTLLVIILARFLPQDPGRRILVSAAMFALGFAFVLTNVMIWVLAQVSFDSLRPSRLRASLVGAVRRPPMAIAEGLAGLGLVSVGIALIDFFMRNDSYGRLLHVFGETKFITHGATSALGGLNTLGVLGPNLPLWPAPDLILLVLIAWTLTRLPMRLWFLPLFALMGPALHSVYARSEAFIFAPDYVPAGIVALALAVNGWRPRMAAGVLATCAVILATANGYGFRQQLVAVRGRSSPPSAFAGLRTPHGSSGDPSPEKAAS
jgi:hypothetical protein